MSRHVRSGRRHHRKFKRIDEKRLSSEYKIKEIFNEFRKNCHTIKRFLFCQHGNSTPYACPKCETNLVCCGTKRKKRIHKKSIERKKEKKEKEKRLK